MGPNVMDRRATLKLLLAAGGCLIGGSMVERRAAAARTTTSMPVIFLAHGSPLLLDDRPWVSELHRWAQAMPRPEAVLMLSAHWEQKPIALSATHTVPLVYDFYGFPPKYYQVTYPAPGAPALADRVSTLLAATESDVDASERGLDHGAYVPLVAMYPQAD